MCMFNQHATYRKNTYLFIYYLIQFCGHSWIFTNMTVRFFSFGEDSMVDTFYAIGLVMRVCQSISLLELLHISELRGPVSEDVDWMEERAGSSPTLLSTTLSSWSYDPCSLGLAFLSVLTLSF
ncbi:hypothetical protein GH733_018330 [Mirounga leonina]|nr:hypothetical protein GH733_018330 [Mirounga leonina]